MSWYQDPNVVMSDRLRREHLDGEHEDFSRRDCLLCDDRDAQELREHEAGQCNGKCQYDKKGG